MAKKRMNGAKKPGRKPPAGLTKIQGRRLRIIGIGGIGSTLVAYLARFLWSQNARAAHVVLDVIDGDHYELKNRERMFFFDSHSSVNKAVAKAVELSSEFGDRLCIQPFAAYIDARNIDSLIAEDDIVFMAVDNFKTRKLISDHCETLGNIVLFNGGNDGVENGQSGTFGNVQIYERKDGKQLENPITRFHPEIEAPSDRAPYELSCEELTLSGAPQLLFTNLAVSSAMLNAFYSWLHDRLDYEEAYLDIMAGWVRPSRRELA